MLGCLVVNGDSGGIRQGIVLPANLCESSQAGILFPCKDHQFLSSWVGLSYLTNLSFSSGVFPNALKYAKLLALQKCTTSFVV